MNFFEQLNTLNAQTTEDILNEFIEVSEQVVAIRARFKSLQKVQAYYDEGLPKLANRIKDIELNTEALVAGIKVYDVPGSDLRLVVPAAGQPIKDDERLGSPAIPFLPVQPSEVKPGGFDFITKPGGL